ncbi:MAG: hypothetical protein WCK84_05600 [Bacteroidota bacterium]
MRIRSIPFIMLILIWVRLVPAQTPVPQDTFNIAAGSMRYPHQLHKWGFRIAAGLSLVMPPKDLLESAIQAPLVNIHMTFGLPWKLSLEGDVTSILVSNQFALGPHVGFVMKNFSLNLGWDVAFCYGQMKMAGFDNKTKIWMHYPNISLGYKLKDIAFTLKGELVGVASVVQTSGTNEVERSKNFYNGFTVAFYIEQRLWKNHVFVIGLKDNYEKLYWPTWMLFSTFNRFYHIPELSFSWIL